MQRQIYACRKKTYAKSCGHIIKQVSNKFSIKIQLIIRYTGIFKGSKTSVLPQCFLATRKGFFLSFFLLCGGTRSLHMPALRPASQAGPMHNPMVYPARPITTVSLAANTYCMMDGHSSCAPRTVGPRVQFSGACEQPLMTGQAYSRRPFVISG